MTVTAERHPEHKHQITLTIVHETMTTTVHEDYTHLRQFWNQLGVHLNEVEKDVAADE